MMTWLFGNASKDSFLGYNQGFQMWQKSPSPYMDPVGDTRNKKSIV